MMTQDLVLPLGSAGDPEFSVAIRPGRPGWEHTGLLIADLDAGDSRTIETGECEYVVMPLASGPLRVTWGERTERLAGRASVFSGAADCVYIPRRTTVTVTSESGGRVAFPFAAAKGDVEVSVVRAADVPVELRGAGQCSRQVQNFGTPGTMAASSMIACEVITPAGNWSSYPPHKHDENRAGVESELEEIYYFEMQAVAGAPAEADPVGVQFVYGTDDRPIDVKAAVRSGDVVLVPHGWHGPAMTPPGYHMYYLNVMAGPGEERVWLICDDPAHGWIRQTWEGQEIDPRLPLGPDA